MAKYHITHSCGHTVTHNIVGTNAHGERDRREQQLTSQVCSDCYRAEQTAAAVEANAGLPALSGSEKQIAWAESIRAKAVASLEEARAQINHEHPLATRAGELIDDVLAQSEARYWIDNRGCRYDMAWLASKIQGGE